MSCKLLAHPSISPTSVLSILYWQGLVGHLLSLSSQYSLLQSSHQFLQYLFVLLSSHSGLKLFQYCFFALILFGDNWGIEISNISCAGILLGDKTAMCNEPAIILGWAELTYMLSYDGLRKSQSTSIS